MKDAINEGIRDWLADPLSTYYLLGSAVGPHPFPPSSADSSSSDRHGGARAVLRARRRAAGRGLACVGGGSNSIGLFSAFLDDPVRLIGAQAAGDGEGAGGHHAAPLLWGSPGVVQGTRTYLLQNADGQIRVTHSIAPGLDYPAVGPEHSQLKDSGRVEYVGVSDAEALDAFRLLSEREGILPALESSHAVAAALRLAPALERSSHVLVNLSGRGDKDVDTVVAASGDAQELGHVAP